MRQPVYDWCERWRSKYTRTGLMQYLNMEPLREQKKEALRKFGEVA